ncbi:MAG: NUDIX hydrolase [uncultured bacterium (gcode 4)]|uniref:NUDIX hydrolase n=1 Tax=uncultured bacterium (gcode 4) TaxID=1234023 RepID=K2GXQ1_9BACT|nr:MAG: NUDIX hydrolase [uncultured bacterium (gcode 4)]
MELIYAIWLTRVSSEKQGRFWDSLDVQEKAIERVVNNKWEILLQTISDVFTWSKKDRPWIKKALEFIKASKVKISKCYIYNIDRNSRWWHDVHYWIKDMFKNVWVKLYDINWVIWDAFKVIEIDWVNTDGYDFMFENPSEYAEELMVMMAKNEKNKMLQRTISQEIRNTKDGYHQRQAHFWLKNIKIKNNEGKAKVIEVNHEIESVWLKKIYELRQIWIPDYEIVNEINMMGFKTRPFKNKWPVPLTIKYLQRLVVNPVYAGIKKEKWTGHKPVKMLYFDWYQSLVDISTWNKANRWKIQIIEDSEWVIEIIYSKKWKESFEPIKEERKTYRPEYSFARVLGCPVCWGYLTPNKSTSKNWTYHHYYQCKWKKNVQGPDKHKNYSVRRDEADKVIKSFLKEVKPNNWLLKALDHISWIYFDSKAKSNTNITSETVNKIKELEAQKALVEENITKYLHLPKTIEIIEKQLQKIDEDIINERSGLLNTSNALEINKSEFIKFVQNCISHTDKMAFDKENPVMIELIFRFIFQEKPTYEEISSHTPNMYPIFALTSHQKNPSFDEFSCKSIWQPHCESNTARRIWNPEF